MRLIDHPQMKSGGENIWPPLLAPPYAEGKADCALEQGVLKDVKYFTTSRLTHYLLLEVECGGKSWPRVVKLDDAHYLKPFFFWLQKQIGKTIGKIGQSDVDF